MNYLHWNEQTLTDFSAKSVTSAYANGYVLTRIGKGAMQQTRSIRIDLKKFELSSENRRILKKTQDISLVPQPIPYTGYDFTIGKCGKDFYEEKFGAGIMSAQKIKEMLTDGAKSNFNVLLSYTLDSHTIGYTISHENDSILHYSYPFYDLKLAPKDMGMGMMIRAIVYAQEKGLDYIYLGSLQRPTDTYKLQFSGIEWFDGTIWSDDIEKAKELLKGSE